MSNNNKGFFLSETIIVLTLVTTAIAFVLPNVMKLYENYVNQTEIYDTPEDLYALKAVYEYLNNNVCTECEDDYKNSNGISYTSDLNFLTDNGCETFEEDFASSNPGQLLHGRIYNIDLGDNGFSHRWNDKTSVTSYYRGLMHTFSEDFELRRLYITGYMRTPISTYTTSNNNSAYEFNKYLKRLKKTTYDPTAYRLIGYFVKYEGGKVAERRFASIKIPNPGTGNCPSSQ